MLEKLSECPACNSKQLHKHMECRDYSVSGEKFNIDKCDNCQLLFTNPRPGAQHIGPYYEFKEYISHTNSRSSITDLLYQGVRSLSLNSKLKLINNLKTNNSLLDYGCGTGHFISKVSNNNWKATGIEPSDKARAIAKKISEARIYANIDEIHQSKSFGVISLWHVLEHIHDLTSTFTLLKNKLDTQGKIILAVPNHCSFDAKHYKEAWAAYDVPRHLYHFNQKSMSTFLEKNGMKVEKIIPMKFDSFYVSLLSEQNLSGRRNLFKSFINGYKSNSYAKYSNEYSSLIYIASLI